MTNLTFTKATKKQSKLRLAFIGPAGSGKTYSSLRVASALVGPFGKIALIDTERGSASKYSHKFSFDVLELDSFSVETYIQAIQAAQDAGYDCLIIDSLSHAWAGKGGLLEFVDTVTARSRSHNAFSEGWRAATPKHNELVDSMLLSRLHLIVTMRSKTEWVVEKDKDGKSVPRKIGLQPIQRDGLEYEFDVVGDIDLDNRYIISKTRCEDLNQKVIVKPGEQLAATLNAWLSDGVPQIAYQEPQKFTPATETNQKQTDYEPVHQPEEVFETPISTNDHRSPEQVKAFIKTTAAKWEGKKISDGKRGLIAPVLETCFATGDAAMKRHQIQKFLTDKSSIRDIADSVLIAIYMWLEPAKDSGGAWVPNAKAEAEALAIVNFLDAGSGQLNLLEQDQTIEEPALDPAPDPVQESV